MIYGKQVGLDPLSKVSSKGDITRSRNLYKKLAPNRPHNLCAHAHNCFRLAKMIAQKCFLVNDLPFTFSSRIF